MLPIVFIIVLAILIFKSARDYGRSPVIWTLAAIVGYFVIQIAVGTVIFIVAAAGADLWGWPATLYDDYSLLIGLISLVPAIGYVLVIWKIVTRVRDDHVPVVKKSPISIYGADE